MCPKYSSKNSQKGRSKGSDWVGNWLDDEASASSKKSHRAKPRTPILARSKFLSPEEANGTVAEVFPNQCRVRLDGNQGAKDLLCSYRRAEVVSKGKDEVRERSPVAVGDRVKISAVGATVEGICQRSNSLTRLAPGREEAQVHHVLAANVDGVVIVNSVTKPEFSPLVVDRFLVACEAAKIPVALVLNKADLLGPDSPSAAPWKLYESLGYQIFEISAKSGWGCDPLLSWISGKTIVFCGHSGVGKTSLLRFLLKQDFGKVQEVNEETGLGRHTTTGAILLGGPDDSHWIDTPGVRDFGVAGVQPSDLKEAFPELRNLRCEVMKCNHLDEPGCLARELPRYASYRGLYEVLDGAGDRPSRKK